jgi:hypothetical protein
VCSLRFPACNAHASYCHLWPAPLYHIFPLYLMNGTVVGKTKRKAAEHKMCVLISSITFFSETFPTLRRIRQGIVISVHWSSCEVPVILVKFE